MKSLQASTPFPSSHLSITKRAEKKSSPSYLFNKPQSTEILFRGNFRNSLYSINGHRPKTNRSTKPKKKKKKKEKTKNPRKIRKAKRNEKNRFNFNYHVKGIPQSSSQVADTDCIKESPPLTRPMKGGQRVAGWGRQFSTGFPRKPTPLRGVPDGKEEGEERGELLSGWPRFLSREAE